MKELIIIPTFNEKNNIQKLIPELLKVTSGDILVVDDNSPDGTAKAVENLAQASPRVYLLKRTQKEGLRKAYIAGFQWGLKRNYDVLIQMDADFSHQPHELPLLLDAIKNGADVAIGSRYINGVRVLGWDMRRLIISIGGNLYAFFLTRVPIMDLTGGFNAWKREVLEKIEFKNIKSEGYAFQIELKFLAYYKGFKLQEVPIVFRERSNGETKMSKKIVREAVFKCMHLGLKVLWWKIRRLV